ncbi:MAG: hypothetical protein JWP06_537 [Candidatus Saccharibacteria bacterium]|nr:hypothetical protein [Candidatus Saccharibacteria bacterium]
MKIVRISPRNALPEKLDEWAKEGVSRGVECVILVTPIPFRGQYYVLITNDAVAKVFTATLRKHHIQHVIVPRIPQLMHFRDPLAQGIVEKILEHMKQQGKG